MVHPLNLINKNILITGGYGYLGSAIVESLAYHGANVFVLGRNITKFNAAFESLENELKNKIRFQECDIKSTESIEKAFATIASTTTIDALINNAFYLKGQSPFEMTDEDWNEGIEGTLSSVFKCIRSIIPYFMQQNFGKIINVSSMYGMIAPDFDVYSASPAYLNPPHYGVAKAGIIQLTKYYASLLGTNNIHVNCVTPGPFPSTEVQQNEVFVAELKSKTCLNKIGKPADLAGIFVFLSSNASDFVTGQSFVIDGGWTTK
jgi:gluconate 5-dehydrogenase